MTDEKTIDVRVIEEQKNYYIVDTPEGLARASLRGVLKKTKKKICAGDIVEFQLTNGDMPEGVILSVRERTSYLSRPAVANLSQVFFVNTFVDPAMNLESMDRFLFIAEVYKLRPIIVFNKMDLVAPHLAGNLKRIQDTYESIGYTTLNCSAYTGAGIDRILALCKGALSAFAGQSGVGKSAILKTIFPGREFRIGELSELTRRGMHTTTAVSLIPLPTGDGYVADTPGFAFVDIPTVDENEVIGYFPELERIVGTCRFNNCRHGDEPGCAVREKVDSGEIVSWRREHFLKIFKEMRERKLSYRKGKERTPYRRHSGGSRHPE